MKLSLATKIFFGFSLVIAVFGAVSIYGVTQINTVRDQLNTLNRSLLPLDRLAAELETLQETNLRTLSGVLHFEDPETKRSLLESNRRSFSRNMLVRLQQAQAVLRRIEQEKYPDEDKLFLEEVRGRLDTIKDQVDGLDRILESTAAGLAASAEPAPEPGTESGAELSPTIPPTDPTTLIEPAGRTLARDVRLLKLSLKSMITNKMLSLERKESSATGVILWLSILAVAVGILVTVLSLVALRPIHRLAEGAQRISNGDFAFTIEPASQDEIGLLASEFNRMARSLGHREQEMARQQEQLGQVNRQLRQSSIDLELMKLYNENIIRSMHNGVLVADARGVITTLNPAAEKLWGLEPAHTIGRPLGELPVAPSLNKLLSSWERVVLGKERMLFEALEFDRGTPDPLLVDLYVSPLLGHDGNPQGVLLVGEDVTEKVNTKLALLRSERLATIGRMSALVAHEIRNPLSSIGLNAELLEEEIDQAEVPLRPEAREILHSVAREVERLTEATDEYLKFARLPKPQLAEEDLNEIIGSLLRFVEAEFEDAGVEVQQRLDPRAAVIRADEAQLRQAFLNLFKNSIESMPGGGKLTVSTERADGVVRIRITDTGKGIDPACLGKIFDPFFSTRDGGTGLGLSLTQQIVTEHGGAIRCESKPGEGTSFVVELPVLAPTRGPS